MKRRLAESLRVINEDSLSERLCQRVIPGAPIFGTPRHWDMEILTYVLEGEVAYKDSLGTSSVIRPGGVQIMSAGTGIQHSEFNNSDTEPVHLLQIWMLPVGVGVASACAEAIAGANAPLPLTQKENQQNATPRYDQRNFPPAEKQGKLRLVASKDGREGSVLIHQDIDLYVSVLSSGDRITFAMESNRFAWIQVARGIVTLNGESLQAGDGVQINSPELLELTTEASAEILLFDLA